MFLRVSSRTRGMTCLLFIALLFSACGGTSSSGSSGSPTGGSAASGIDVVQFTVSGAVAESRTLTVHPAEVNQMTFVGSYDTNANKIFNFFINPSGNPGADTFDLAITKFTGPGSYTLQWSDQDKVENLDVGLAFNGGVDWSLQDSPGKTCQATVSAASAQMVGGFTMEEVQGTFSCPELDAKALFDVKPIQVSNGSFTVFVRSV
jgi:hypothetical protein